MDTFFQALAAISGPLAGILAYMLIEGKRKAKTRAKADNEAETMLTHWYEYLPAAWFTPEGRWCKEEREPRGTSHNL